MEVCKGRTLAIPASSNKLNNVHNTTTSHNQSKTIMYNSNTCKGVDISNTRKGVDISNTRKGVDISNTRKGVDISNTRKGVDISNTRKGVDISNTRNGVDLCQWYTQCEVIDLCFYNNYQLSTSYTCIL